MKNLGLLSYFLGIAVTRHTSGLFISQKKYAAEIIDRVGMSLCKSSPTPVDTKSKLGDTTSKPFEDPSLYRSFAGALQYLTFTRLDITYAVQQIQGTMDFGVYLYSSFTSTLISYIDANWGRCPDTSRSTSGYYVFLCDNLISWSAKRQATLSRSSAKVEYRGVANVHQRTKHIEMDIHFVRKKVARGQVRVLHVPLRYQIVDICTKGLPLVLFKDFRDNLNIQRPPASTARMC
ncbi:uncharacterized mitochondrial protein AtMg00810-like [Arachis stenosperma]|uniref:uncharacterized mitochondrial protein AtMg00810-like n=1 Tax=Arachis stenosperma TaxID=217475 RepID=UPI0025ACE4BE|nr:uncharacterized mitochondrial protein AtMg00810-like [Arachis stenosperma]